MHTDHKLINVREAYRLLEPVARVYGTNARWLRVRTADYFGTLDFTSKHMLEVGADNGLYTCCVSVLGAARPVALEPELKGATDSAVSTFRRSLDRLHLQIVELYQLSLQEFV